MSNSTEHEQVEALRAAYRAQKEALAAYNADRVGSSRLWRVLCLAKGDVDAALAALCEADAAGSGGFRCKSCGEFFENGSTPDGYCMECRPKAGDFGWTG